MSAKFDRDPGGSHPLEPPEAIGIAAAHGPAARSGALPAVHALRADPFSSGDLAAFIAAVDAGTVCGAADALYLTQPAVTKRLQALERRAGVKLLERGRFGVRPTAAGHLLYPEARRAVAALIGAEAVLTAHRGGKAGHHPLAAGDR